MVSQIAWLPGAGQGLTLAVEGHTDASDAAVHNRALSLRRAPSVVTALTTWNIAHQPIAYNGSEQGCTKNRGVERVRT